MGFKTFANNELLTAADVNAYLMRQTVARVANLTAENAIPTPEAGMLIYRTDLKLYRWRTAAGAWADFVNTVPFAAVEQAVSGTGTVSGVAANAEPLTGLSMTQAVTTSRACRAKVTLQFQGVTSNDGVGFNAGVDCSGVTSLALPSGDRRLAQVWGAQPITYSISYIISLAAGLTTFRLVGRALGAGGTRTVSNPVMTIESIE